MIRFDLQRSFDEPADALTSDAPVISRGRAGAPRPHTLVEGLADRKIRKLGHDQVNLAAVEIGERLRDARHLRGMTQAQLAVSANCKQSDISDIERGKGREGPSYRLLRALARALEVELPINPAPFPEFVNESEGAVIFTSASYEDCMALAPGSFWSEAVESAISHLVEVADKAFAPPTCHLLNVGPAAKARFRLPDNTVIAKLWGKGDVEVRNAIHRFKREHEPLAIVDVGSEISIETHNNDTMLLVAMPASVLLQRPSAEVD